MDSESRRDLLLGAATALATVALLRLDFAAAAAFAVAALLAALTWSGCTAALAALPVLFATIPRPPEPAPLPGPGPVVVDGRVTAVLRDLVAGEQRLQLATPFGSVELHCPTDVEALPGDRVRATARCSLPAVLGGRPGLHAAAPSCTVEAGPASLPRWCAHARLALERALHEVAPPQHAALLSTLALGRGARLPEDVADAHRATGLSHLLAVSGAHAAMLAWMLGLQPFGGGRRRPVSRSHLVVATALLFAYGAITGMEPPMFRALLGYLLVAIGSRLGRRVSSWQALLWPALFSCVATPDAVLGPSFGLSYAAVSGLSLAGPPRSSAPLERFVLAPIRASTWAAIATAPLTLYWFGQFAPWTVLLTPLLAPLVLVLLVLSLGAAVAQAAGLALAAHLGLPLQHVADLYTGVLVLADGLPATPVHAVATPTASLVLAGAAAGLGALVLLGGRRGAAAACALACAPQFAAPPPAPPEATLFAIGHGQALLVVLDDGTTALLDCGSQDHPGLPARKVERALRRRRIDWLVLSHSDHDHVSAVPELLARLHVVRAVMPAAMRGDELSSRLCAAGTATWFLEPGEVARPRPDLCIHAPDPGSVDDNDGSLWVTAQFAGLRLVTPGDAGPAGIAAALASGNVQACDVLVLPHHGRPNDGAEALLRASSPRCCLASDRVADGASVLGELAARGGVPTFATATHGDLVVRGGRAGLHVRAEASHVPAVR